MIIKRIGLLFVLLLLVSGQAGSAQSDCLTEDWEDLGLRYFRCMVENTSIRPSYVPVDAMCQVYCVYDFYPNQVCTITCVWVEPLSTCVSPIAPQSAYDTYLPIVRN